ADNCKKMAFAVRSLTKPPIGILNRRNQLATGTAIAKSGYLPRFITALSLLALINMSVLIEHLKSQFIIVFSNVQLRFRHASDPG
ncbi:hypothetical protein, partial [Aeromonas sp. SCS5]|uniref:hypothetical protein n=1 Tax=Aeromonas sp. SCS5 TaxID=1519205 RepID=UPI001959E5E9